MIDRLDPEAFRNHLHKEIAAALPTIGSSAAAQWTETASGELPSYFAVTDLAVASVGAAAHAMSALSADAKRAPSPVTIDRRLASFWFKTSLRPTGWSLSPQWDPVAGDYAARDGWIRLHTNAPHHQKAALAVLGVSADRDAVAQAVSSWTADELEAAVVNAGGAAATMRGLSDWAAHPQGRAVMSEPLIAWTEATTDSIDHRTLNADRPLHGYRILDLTRVLAGPVATRFLAAFGADVLRIDPPNWNEPAVEPEMTLGKRCAGLDLKTPNGRDALLSLAETADVIVHGYRPGALARMGCAPETLRAQNPALIDVALDAYGWSGPWAGRRGFDSLVQMSSGIAQFGMEQANADRPTPLPAQALDHATGYLMAAAVVHALTERRRRPVALSARLSLARTAALLVPSARAQLGEPPKPEQSDDVDVHIEATAWGPAHRLQPPFAIEALRAAWAHPAGNLRTSEAEWTPS
ncbi:MAG: CoA transferase [Pseudomonadota bacterium]